MSFIQKDYKSLCLSDGKNVLLKNEFGQTVLLRQVDAGLRRGMVFIPMGPWANVLLGRIQEDAARLISRA